MALKTETFNFFVPITVQKSDPDGDGDGKRYIQGIASTDHLDLQGEKVSQKGIDFEYFLKFGHINDDHKDGPEHKVGEPLEAKMTKKGLFVKGYLYKGKDRADFWWEHLNALEKNNSSRKVGFSIQGKVQRRSGNVIEKCWLQDIAITASPVNTNTWAEILKSLSAQEWDDSLDEETEKKALSAGGAGSVLVPEALEREKKVTTYKSLSDYGEDSLSREQSITALQIEKGWSRTTSAAVVDSYLASKGIFIGELDDN